MKESSWEECVENNVCVSITPNTAKAKSLEAIAKGRIDYLAESIVKESNANYLFEGYYSSVLEVLHALLLVNGFKVNNHLCLGFYLRDVLKRDDLFRMFDDSRVKRDKLVYYGKRMEFAVAKESIQTVLRLMEELKSI